MFPPMSRVYMAGFVLVVRPCMIAWAIDAQRMGQDIMAGEGIPSKPECVLRTST
jgi:hypothetical protein